MLNVITMVGRLTRDPELRKTNSGTQVGGFTIACDDGRKGPNGEKQTIFMDCNIFGNQSDTLVKFFRKGNLIGVSGRLTSRKYVNKEGVNVTAYSIICDHIEFIESSEKMKESAGGQAVDGEAKPAEKGADANQQFGTPTPLVTEISDDELPF